MAMVVAGSSQGSPDEGSSGDEADPGKVTGQATDIFNSAARHVLLALECRAALVAHAHEKAAARSGGQVIEEDEGSPLS